MGCRREEFERLRHETVMWINDKWATPTGKSSRGADVLTRAQRASFNPRFHSGRRHSKKRRR